MNFRILFPAFIAWLALVALTVVNTFFRTLALMPHLSVAEASVISVAIQIGLTLLTTRVFVGMVKDRFTAKDMLLAGLFWVVLGLATELSLGLAQGASLREILGAYNVYQGQYWIVIPLFQLIAPYIMYRLLKR